MRMRISHGLEKEVEMASAVWKGHGSSRFSRKANRAVFERPQKQASPAAFLQVPAIRSPTLASDRDREDGDLAASCSTPHFTFSTEGDPERSPVPLPRKKTAVTAQISPIPSPLTLEPPRKIRAGASTADLPLREGGPSSASLLADRDENSPSPVIGKNWKQMQVSPSHLFTRAERETFRITLQEATFTNWVNERLRGKQSNYAGPRVQNLQ